MPRPKLYLVDGANYLFRAFYAIRDLKNSKGLPTNALYGFANMMKKLVREERPDYLLVCLDTKGPTFRDEIFAEYKAHRPEPPEEIVAQFPYFKPVIEALGIAMVEKPGFEADDLIGTLAKRFSPTCDVWIVSGDKDLMQLIGDGISMIDEMRGVRFESRDVMEKFGVNPSQVADVLGLAGDTSDNIPGVQGIGIKTASKLIAEHGSIEQLIAKAHTLKGALSGKIKAGADSAILSKRLATIDCKVDIECELDSLKPILVQSSKAKELFRELEFTNLITEEKKVEEGVVIEQRPGFFDFKIQSFRTVSKRSELEEIRDEVLKAGKCAIQIAPKSPDSSGNTICGIALAWTTKKAAYIPIGHIEGDTPNFKSQNMDLFASVEVLKSGQLALELIRSQLNQLFTNNSVEIIGCELNRQLCSLRESGFKMERVDLDLSLASYILNPDEDHSLQGISAQFLGHEGAEDEIKDHSHQEPSLTCEWACSKAATIFELAPLLRNKIAMCKQSELLTDIEMPLLDVIVDMELCGMGLDTKLLSQMSGEFASRLATLEAKIFSIAGESFNLNSPKQMGIVLFEKMGLAGGKKTKTGYSTNIEVIEELANTHEIGKLILEYRSISKLKSTYIDALPELIDKRDNRIHTTLHQARTATGRLSSSNPNLQNIPIRSSEGRRIREAFIAPEGKALISADYSQIELRVLAHLSKEPALIDAFRADADVHALTASQIFNKGVGEVTREERAVGKTVNFATIYGQGAYGLSKQLGISVSDAASYIDAYFAKYPVVASYREEVLSNAKRDGFVTTLFGRKRFVPDITSQNRGLVQLAERIAFNTVFQGSAADIIKIAMIRISRELKATNSKIAMLMQVHDELIFELPEEEITAATEMIKEIMEGACELEIPLIVDIGTGSNWSAAH